MMWIDKTFQAIDDIVSGKHKEAYKRYQLGDYKEVWLRYNKRLSICLYGIFILIALIYVPLLIGLLIYLVTGK